MTKIVIDQRSQYGLGLSLSKNSKRVITPAYAKQLVKIAERQERRRQTLPDRKAKKAAKKQAEKDKLSAASTELASLKKQLFELTQKSKNKFAEPPKYVRGMGSEFYATREWRSLRWDVISNASGKCSVCGKSKKEHGVIMHVDHIKPRSKFQELELDKNNLQLLCEECNIGKGAKPQTF